MANKELAKQIETHMGGSSNIKKVWNCMTRLRFNVINDELVDIEALKQLKGVMGVRYTNGQYQVIVGNTAIDLLKYIDHTVSVDNEEVKKPKGIISNFFDTISGIFTPVLPAIAGTGLLKAILSVVVLIDASYAQSGVYQTFEMVSDASFYFLPFLLAWSSSVRFEVNTGLALTLAGGLMYPTLINGGDPIMFMGLKVPLIAYNGSVLPIILSVLLMKYVYNFLDRKIPSSIRGIVVPMLSLAIVMPITYILIAPLGNYASVYLAMGIDWLFENVSPIAGLLFTGFMPMIIMVGMHYAFFPTAMQSIQNTGFDLVLLPANLIHNSAQAGAAFAVGVKAKDKDVKSLAMSTGISAVFGITEPAMYGVNLKYKKPFYVVMGVSGAIGMVTVMLGLKSFTFAVPGILSIAGYAEPNGGYFNLILALVAYIAAFVGSFVITLMMKIDFE